MNCSQLTSQLERVSSETEGIYIDVAHAYEQIMGDFEKNYRQVAGFFEEGRAIRGDKGTFKDSAQILSCDKRQLLESITNSLERNRIQEEKLFEHNERSIGYVSTLEGELNAIRELTEEVSFIALNLMIAAIKSGKAGGAFPIITKEYKRNAMVMVQSMEEAVRHGTSLKEDLRLFQSRIKEVKESQKRLLTQIHHWVDSYFTSIQEEVDWIRATFRSLSDSYEKIKIPLFEIMEEVQQQDIVRQSIEQLNIVLKDMNNDNDGGLSNEADPDVLAFQERISEISVSILADLHERLQESFLLFRDCSARVEFLIRELDGKQKGFKENGGTGDSRDSGDFSGSSPSVSLSMGELMVDIDCYRSAMNETMTINTRLINRIKLVEEQLIEIEKSNCRYDHLNSLSMIEVEKEPAIKHMKTEIHRIRMLNGKMAAGLKRVYAIPKAFIASVDEAREKYDKNRLQGEESVENFRDFFTKQSGQFESIQKSVQEVVDGYAHLTCRFFDDLEQTKAEVERIQILSGLIEGVKISIGQTRKRLISDFASICPQHSLSEWKIQEERIQSILDRFTIFEHKKEAWEKSGVLLEGGGEAGELILF